MPVIFLDNDRSIYFHEGATSLYLLNLKHITDIMIVKIHGTPKKAKASLSKLPMVVLVNIYIVISERIPPDVCISDDNAGF